MRRHYDNIQGLSLGIQNVVDNNHLEFQLYCYCNQPRFCFDSGLNGLMTSSVPYYDIFGIPDIMFGPGEIVSL